MGPSLKGMGVSEAVGVILGVKVSLGKGVFVGVPVGVGVNVLVEVRVRVGVNVSVTVGVGLMKNPRTDGFVENTHAPTTTVAKTRLIAQNAVTILPSVFDDEAGINRSPLPFDAGYRMHS
jgi:hypothetical protein